MIERLVGICAAVNPGNVILDVNGVGYGVDITDAASVGLAVGQELTVWVHTHVREDAIRLFGFLSGAERQVFALLLGVNGVGPKLAMAIMSTVSLATLAAAVAEDDGAPLEEVPGIGPRQSKKIVLELKPKWAKLEAFAARRGAVTTAKAPLFASATPSRKTMADLKSALENLGYREKEIAPLIRRFEKDPPAKTVEELVPLALRELAGGGMQGPAPLEELF
jgi:Holliday junction DNA helicase RuvA